MFLKAHLEVSLVQGYLENSVLITRLEKTTE